MPLANFSKLSKKLNLNPDTHNINFHSEIKNKNKKKSSLICNYEANEAVYLHKDLGPVVQS